MIKSLYFSIYCAINKEGCRELNNIGGKLFNGCETDVGSKFFR